MSHPADEDSGTPALGAVIGGRFRLTSILGRGSSGAVYRAHQRAVDRDVAIKFLSAPQARDPETRARFAAEAKIIARLKSPHTVQLYDYGRLPDGTFYIVMELVEGETLETMLADGRTLPPIRCREIFRDVAASLQEAHGLGVVHRDIKPGNILVASEDGRARVLDFGVSKSLGQEVSWTQEGVLIGTPAYMAPELWSQDAGVVGPATDIYALGAMMYEALTGALPFRGATAAQMMNAHLNERPSDLPTSVPNARHLGAVIHRCLAKRPGDRFESVEAFVAALDAETETRPARWIPLAVAALAVAGTAVVWSLASPTEPPAPPEPVAKIDALRGPSAVAVGDFDGDGLLDLVVGSADEPDDGGRFFISYGGPGAALVKFDQNDVPGEHAMPGARFGATLVVGDFNQDRFDDLAVGAPMDDRQEVPDAGVVIVFFGSPSGLEGQSTTVLDQSHIGSATNERDDHFGAVLAVGDFNGDTFDDLAVGVPDEDTWNQEDAGMVAIMFGGAGVDAFLAKESISQNAIGGAQPAKGDRFGYVVAVGNFNGDEYDDLAIGAPWDEGSGDGVEGEVSVIYGGRLGLYPIGLSDTFDHRTLFGSDDRTALPFGRALAAHDSDGDGYDDLVVSEEGAFDLVYGSATALLLSAATRVDGLHPGTPRYATADIDGDGFSDIAVTSGTSHVTLVYGRAEHDAVHRRNERDLIVPNSQLVTGDFNRDGRVEVALTTAPDVAVIVDF